MKKKTKREIHFGPELESDFLTMRTLRKPILFYMYDWDDYRDNLRGFHFSLADKTGK